MVSSQVFIARLEKKTWDDASFSIMKDLSDKCNGQSKSTIKKIKNAFWCFWACSLDTCGDEPSDWLSYANMLSWGNGVITCQKAELKLEVML